MGRRRGRRYWRRRAREARRTAECWESLVDTILARLWRLEGMMEASEDGQSTADMHDEPARGVRPA